MDFPLKDLSEVESTKDKILLIASEHFSKRGYSDVSIRDITDEIHIKPASFYAHFENKEALFNEIVDIIEKVYRDYYGRLDKEVDKATNFAEMLNSLYIELKEVYHMFIYHGVALLSAEMLRNEKARNVFNEVYMKTGIAYCSKVFERCIEKQWVKPFDTKTMATLLMHTVFVGTLMRVQEAMEYTPIYDVTEMFVATEQFMLNAVEVLV